MNDIAQSSIVVGEFRDRTSKVKKLFSGHLLSFLNKATLRHRNGRTNDFYWLPYAQKCLWENQWATLAVYRDNAVISHTNGWAYGDTICGPVIIKRKELILPCVAIGQRTQDEATNLQTAETMMSGFWHIAENPYSDKRHLFADNLPDLVAGKLLFS